MGTENINTLALSLEGQGEAELEPGLRVTGSAIWAGSGHGSIPQRPDPAF